MLLLVDAQLQENNNAIHTAKNNARLGLRLAWGFLQDNVMLDNAALKDGIHYVDPNNKFSYDIVAVKPSDEQPCYGLLVGSDGQFKKNLSAYLIHGEGLKDEGPIFHNSENASPKWGFLKSFYEICEKKKGGEIKAQAADAWYNVALPSDERQMPTIHPTGPRIAGCFLGFGFENAEQKSKAVFDGKIKVKMFLSLLLWNPYDFILDASDCVFKIEDSDRRFRIHCGNESYELNLFKKNFPINTQFKPREFKLLYLGSNKGVVSFSETFNPENCINQVVSIKNISSSSHVTNQNVSTSKISLSGNSRNFLAFNMKLLPEPASAPCHIINKLRLASRLEWEGDLTLLTKSNSPHICLKFINTHFVSNHKFSLSESNPYAPLSKPQFWEIESKLFPWPLSIKDFFPIDSHPPIFFIPEKITSLASLRFANLTPCDDCPAFPFCSGCPASDLADYSLKLNEALWDHYFVYNPEHYISLGKQSVLDFDHAAESFFIKDAFNINIATITDWTKLLSFLDLTDRQLQSVAKELVRQVQERGPFNSLADFINRPQNDNPSPLRSALDLVNSDISQAQVLEHIGHRLTTRSDTFIIRVIGRAIHPITKELITTASCEALMQRFPEHLDPKNQKLGLRYKVLSFRWLK